MKCLKCCHDLGKRSRGGICKKCGFEFAVRKGEYLTPGIGLLWDALSGFAACDLGSSDRPVTIQKLRELLRSPATFMEPLEAAISASPDQVHALERRVAKQIGDALMACDAHAVLHPFAYASATLGLSPIDLLRQNHERQLLAWRESAVVSGVKTLPCGSSCAACKSFGGSVFTIEQALTMTPLPCVGCTSIFGDERSVPFCGCCYIAVVDDA